MLKLKDINKDRRFKLAQSDIEKIIMCKGLFTQVNIAKTYQISRQRVQQLWADPEVIKEKNIRLAKKQIARYREDEEYKKEMSQKKKEWYRYKLKELKKYAKNKS